MAIVSIHFPTPKVDELWPSTPGGMVCPACFSKVPAGKKLEHTEWHQGLRDLLLLLGGSQV